MNKATQTEAREFRPSPTVLKRTRQRMAGYTFVIQPDAGGGFLGSAAELPGTVADGDTFEECARNLNFAVESVVASYLADGEEPPAPVAREKRTEQVNLRFTPTERSILERESIRQGFRGIGDLIRAEVIRRFGPANP